ncbi:ThiF family adenylyltransferase [Candidatus Kaiserbacteria bacterium]|nr:ThiF family adenylyltransferase [Candidatus Kaiserbacteria bacterium]
MDSTSLPPAWSYREAFDRNIGLISEENQEKLHATHVAIAGMGGVGGIYATTLARLGIGRFTIADPDRFELSNTNRQQGASAPTFGASKRATMERLIREINPSAEIRSFEALASENAGDFLAGVKIAIDGIDFFSIAPRRLLYRESRARGIPVLGAAPIGFGSSMINFDPAGVSFDDYFDIRDDLTEQEQIFQFALGLAPLLLQRPYFAPKGIDFVGHRAPSSVLGTLACANMVGCEVYKIVIGLPYERAPVSRQFDPYVRKLRRCTLRGGNRHPIQRIKKWYFKRVFGLA